MKITNKTISVINISFDDIYYNIIPLDKYDGCEKTFLVYFQDAYATPVSPQIKTLIQIEEQFGSNIGEFLKPCS